ncbi:hypothetical protein [Acinetobacter indicus]|uniref:hypothetical protein n=1 Tax=Acinetobacter indicus TaxID=756892 RepID=UPI00398A4DC2
MSDLVLKSPLLTGLNFKYSQDSVIRFVGKRNISFFDCFNIPEKILIDLINYTIEHSDESFHVSYYTYKAGIPLYISPNKLSSKPHWFNQAEYTESFRSSPSTNYFSIPLSESMIKRIDAASKALKIQKGHLIMLATLTEYSPNPWSGNRTEPFENMMECALNLQPYLYEKPHAELTDAAKGLDWTDIASELTKMVGEDACQKDKISAFIIKARNAFSAYKDKLKDDQEFDNFKYSVSAFRADGSLVHKDVLPASFSLRNLDPLFSQNMKYYKHVLYLEVYDPFDDETFVYYPSLTNIYENEKSQSMFFSVPASFSYWLSTICGTTLRSRNSTLRQALHNFLTNWKEQWAAIPKEQKPELFKAFSRLGATVQSDPNYSHHDADDDQQKVKEKRPRGRPRKDDGNSTLKVKRPRGRPPKSKVENVSSEGTT